MSELSEEINKLRGQNIILIRKIQERNRVLSEIVNSRKQTTNLRMRTPALVLKRIRELARRAMRDEQL